MKLRAIVLAVSSIALFSCTKNIIETPEDRQHWNILNVNVDSLVEFGDSLTLSITCPTSSGCDIITDVISELKRKKVYIKVFGYHDENRGCHQAAIKVEITHKILFHEKGNYKLILQRPNGNNIIREITIQ
jgi:hypothetical protein